MSTIGGQEKDFRTDALPVYSRVSWGAILAGVAVAFALYFLMSLLGVAVGLSVTDQGDEGLGVGAAIWAVVAIVIALFAGGWVTTRFTAGENVVEAVVYGLVVWGVLFVLLLWMVGLGLGMGFNAMVGMTGGATTAGQAAALDEQMAETAAEAAWWAFAGTLLSMLASIGGAVMGAATGPMEAGGAGRFFVFRRTITTQRPAGA